MYVLIYVCTHVCMESLLCMYITIERELCFPNPCEHDGSCSITEDGYVCNCDGTGYTGEKCDVLVIDTPDLSELAVNSPTTVLLSAQSDQDFELMLITDDENSLVIEPSTLLFTQTSTQHNVSITVTEPGLYTLEFNILDDTLNYQPIPSASILVSDESNTSYCEERNITCGLMQPGCCSASETQLDLDFKCPPNDNRLLLKSTCGWVSESNSNPLHSVGIIFSSINGFDMPVAIAGARFFPRTTQIYLDNVNRMQFNSGCEECEGDGNCETERLSVNTVEEFLNYDALALTYLHQSTELIPRWLMLKVLQSDRAHDFRSYVIQLYYSNALNEVQGCNELTPLTDGLYSILVYTGNLEVTLDKETTQFTSNTSSVCFATNLCEGSASPLYVDISDDAQKTLDQFEFMRDLRSRGWDVTIKNLIISDTSSIPEPLSDLTSQYSYWNGIEHFSPNLQNPNMITKVEFTKSFIGNTSIEAIWNFYGNVHWHHKDFNGVCMFIV